MLKALLTGSRVYGRPKRESDLDLVLQVDTRQLDLFRQLADEVVEHNKSQDEFCRYTGSETACVRFGRLNLLLVTDPVKFAVWEKGTDECVNMKPCGREEAVKVFKRHRKDHGVDSGDSNGTPRQNKSDCDRPAERGGRDTLDL